MITAEKHVFISYARADGKALAERLRQSLIADGISAWRDERDLDPYQDFTGEIETAIEQACHVVVCLTPTIAARKDSFVRREILYSQGCGIPITPLVAPGFPAAATSAGQARADFLLALGYVGDPSGQEALLPALADPTAELRGCAAIALGLIGDIRAVEPLRALLTDQSVIGRHPHAEAGGTLRVDQVARDALQAIGARTGTSV